MCLCRVSRVLLGLNPRLDGKYFSLLLLLLPIRSLATVFTSIFLLLLCGVCISVFSVPPTVLLLPLP